MKLDMRGVFFFDFVFFGRWITKMKSTKKLNNSSSNITALSLLSSMKAEAFTPRNVHHEKLLLSQQYYSHVVKVSEQHPKVAAAWSKSVFPHYDAKLCIEVPENLIRSSTQAQEMLGWERCEIPVVYLLEHRHQSHRPEKEIMMNLMKKNGNINPKSTVPLRSAASVTHVFSPWLQPTLGQEQQQQPSSCARVE